MKLAAVLLLAAAGVLSAAPAVTVCRIPHGGLQPRAAVDSQGRLHLVYFSGDPKAGDLFYVTAPASPEPQWSAPIPVNHFAGSAVALGTIRGPQIALGKGDRVHVAWNGSTSAPKGSAAGAPMLYARLNAAGDAFEPERNLMTWAGALDGGGSIAADGTGNVYVVWHSNTSGQGETGRVVVLAHSSDGGDTFPPERRVEGVRPGACACCGLGVLAGADGQVFIQYRAATDPANRPIALLTSRDYGASFTAGGFDPWAIRTCPMSSQALAGRGAALFRAWETNGRIFASALLPGRPDWTLPEAAPGAVGKHPALAVNSAGEHLLAWTTGTGWARGGGLAWQVYDAQGRPTAAHGAHDGVPAWSLLSALALPSGDFLVLY